ncbi:nitrogen fixation protein NifZ [Magnetococcus sp. PR-3]|uniref:nitrogen fixation protein NifZ n=1 Tax=Magnetococcus sp. PR-3 TaxID=3120355 RepID=UPI002FCE5038
MDQAIIEQKYQDGQALRLTKTIRNDGTFPGKRTGEILIRRGTVGYVRRAGVFLQEYVIYEMHFIDEDLVVGCRESELQDAELPWVNTEFEPRDRVVAKVEINKEGQLLIPEGENGTITDVFTDAPQKVRYQVQFGERFFTLPEPLLMHAQELDNHPEYVFNQTQKALETPIV